MSIKGIGKRIGDIAYRFATAGCGCDGTCPGCQEHCAEKSVSAHEKLNENESDVGRPINPVR